ncbi:MAG: hypothetical protein WCS89_02075 [Candidatus Paceibacterota bacterium]
MNTLSYRINKDVLFKDLIANSGAFEVVLDGNPQRRFFNIQEFEKSLEKDGFYEICLGRCLISACCGVYVEVVHREDKVIWKRFLENMDGVRVSEIPIRMPDGNDGYEVRNFPSMIGKLIIYPPLEFNKEEYDKLVKQLKALHIENLAKK